MTAALHASVMLGAPRQTLYYYRCECGHATAKARTPERAAERLAEHERRECKKAS